MTDAATRARDGWRDPMEMVVGDAEARLAAVKASYDAELAAMRETVRSLAADAARLEWLAREEATVEFAGDEAGDYRVRFGPFTLQRMTKAHEVYHDDLREAIDAAMAAANARAPADAFPVPEVPNA